VVGAAEAPREGVMSLFGKAANDIRAEVATEPCFGYHVVLFHCRHCLTVQFAAQHLLYTLTSAGICAGGAWQHPSAPGGRCAHTPRRAGRGQEVSSRGQYLSAAPLLNTFPTCDAMTACTAIAVLW
jgi:hypothetical protein